MERQCAFREERIMRYNKNTIQNNRNTTQAQKTGIIAPWIEYQKRVKALFGRDPEIIVGEVYEPDGNEVDYAFDIEVRNHRKFEALDAVLPAIREFGNVTLGIQIFDEENIGGTDDIAAIYQTLFRDNPIVQDVKIVVDQFCIRHAYVLFAPEVIQYYRDEMTDYNGLFSGLAQDIAKEIFEDKTGNVHFCTAPVEEISASSNAQ